MHAEEEEEEEEEEEVVGEDDDANDVARYCFPFQGKSTGGPRGRSLVGPPLQARPTVGPSLQGLSTGGPSTPLVDTPFQEAP